METFLDSLRQVPIVAMACATADISRSTVYRHRKLDPAFAEAWDDALEEGIDRLEQLAWKGAEKGETSLLMFLLKAFRPSKFRDMKRSDFQPIEFTLRAIPPAGES